MRMQFFGHVRSMAGVMKFSFISSSVICFLSIMSRAPSCLDMVQDVAIVAVQHIAYPAEDGD